MPHQLPLLDSQHVEMASKLLDLAIRCREQTEDPKIQLIRASMGAGMSCMFQLLSGNVSLEEAATPLYCEDLASIYLSALELGMKAVNKPFRFKGDGE